MDPEATMSWTSGLGITLGLVAIVLSLIGLVSVLASVTGKQQDDSGPGWMILPGSVIVLGIASFILVNI